MQPPSDLHWEILIMINLIPNEEKKRKVRDFYFRLSVVFLFILGFSVLVACVVFLPSYFISSVKKNFINNQLTNQKAQLLPEVDKEILIQISDLEKRLILIENADKNKYLISTRVINEIISKKMSDIKIDKISYQDSPTKSIHISGTAKSRERLLLFRKALENDPEFKKVDLPISNFVRGSNISFFLTLIPS